MLDLDKNMKLGPSLDQNGQDKLTNLVKNACQALIANEDTLNIMDSGSGDSDCGSTLRRGADAILLRLKNNPEISEHPSQLFHMIGKVLV